MFQALAVLINSCGPGVGLHASLHQIKKPRLKRGRRSAAPIIFMTNYMLEQRAKINVRVAAVTAGGAATFLLNS